MVVMVYVLGQLAGTVYLPHSLSGCGQAYAAISNFSAATRLTSLTHSADFLTHSAKLLSETAMRLMHVYAQPFYRPP